MRAFIVAAAVALASIGLGSCWFGELVSGNGDVVTESRSVPAFSSVRIEGSGTLRVHQGAAQVVTLTSDSNILPYLTASVSGSELTIGIKAFTNIVSSTRMEYDVTIPSLVGVAITGSGNANVDSFAGDSFYASLSGSGGLSATLDYANVVLDVSGSGRTVLGGSATSLVIANSGSAGIAVGGLTAADARVSISGSGSVSVRATRSLDASISGSGWVNYWGNPLVTLRISGSGSVYRAGN